jgi:hypothetical protein
MNKYFNKKKHWHVIFVQSVKEILRVSPSTWKMVVGFVFDCTASVYVNVWIISSFAINWQQKVQCV